MTRPVDRWRIQATITVTAPIAIRTGEEDSTRPELPLKATTVQAIALDVNGNPYIPGSAIKGLLRRLAASHDVCTLSSRRLLGDMARQREGAEEATAWGGAAEFRNAYLQEPANNPLPLVIKGQTAINRGSRTAADGMLRSGPIVAEGTVFALDIVLDRADRTCAQLLTDLMALVDGKGQNSAIGSGNGRIGIVAVSTSHWDADAIKRWAESDSLAGWLDDGKEASFVACAPAPLGKLVHFHFELEIDGYFLPGIKVEWRTPDDRSINAIPYSSKPHAGRREPGDLVRPELAASSVDGALRTQAERIYRTMIASPAEDWSRKPAPAPLEELFGSRDRKGLVTPDDCIATCDLPLVAVNAAAQDRISGGVYGSGSVTRLVFEAPVLAGGLSINFRHQIAHDRTGQPGEGMAERSLSAEAIGLLALTLRDLAEGDIALGSGTRNGYGAVAALRFGKGGWQDMLRAIAAAWQEGAASPQTQQQTINDAIAAFLALATPQNAAVEGIPA